MVKISLVIILLRIWVRVLGGNDVPSAYVGFWRHQEGEIQSACVAQH